MDSNKDSHAVDVLVEQIVRAIKNIVANDTRRIDALEKTVRDLKKRIENIEGDN